MRGGKAIPINLPVRKSRERRLIQPLKGRRPAYFVWGPLSFSTVTEEFVDSVDGLSAYWVARKSPLAIRRFDRIAFDGEELVVVTRAFPHKSLRGYRNPSGQVVSTVNGTKIKNLDHFVKTLRNQKSRFVEFEFAERHTAKLVFDRKSILAASDQILIDNGIPRRAAPTSLLEIWNGK